LFIACISHVWQLYFSTVRAKWVFMCAQTRIYILQKNGCRISKRWHCFVYLQILVQEYIIAQEVHPLVRQSVVWMEYATSTAMAHVWKGCICISFFSEILVPTLLI
jgi:hypothetical protein